MTGGKHKAALEMLGRLFKPAPMVPMTRSEFHKSLQQVKRGNSPYSSSTPFLKPQYTNLGVLVKILSSDLHTTTSSPINSNDIVRQFRQHLSSTKYPMTLYEKLKLADELTKEACLSILFNRNLTSYSDVEKIATEAAIPASYIVTKLLQLGNQPDHILQKWYSRIPSVSALWSFIRDSGVTELRKTWNIQSLEHSKKSMQQYQMDLAAHMWWNVRRHGAKRGYELWSEWVDKTIPSSTLKELLKPSSLQLLQRAAKSPETLDTVIRIVEWDESIIQLLSQESRRNLILEVVDHCMAAGNPSQAARFIQLNHGALTSIECAQYSEMVLRHWFSTAAELKAPGSLGLAKGFVRWALEHSEGTDLHTRGSLERLKHQLAEVAVERRRQHAHSSVLDV